MDSLTQVQIVVYGFSFFGIVLGILALKYGKPEPPKEDHPNK